MLVLTQSQRMVINVEYVDCMFIKKEIIKKQEKYGLYCVMAFDQEKVAIAYYETEKEAMEELKLMLNCWKHRQDKKEVIERIHEAAKYIPLERLCLSPQCGFASCEIGNKLTEEQQWAKLKLVKEIAEEVWG